VKFSVVYVNTCILAKDVTIISWGWGEKVNDVLSHHVSSNVCSHSAINSSSIYVAGPVSIVTRPKGWMSEE
jgi:hypothetical protein